MTNQQEKLRDVAWSELFRWLLLLRSVRIALMARVMILGAIGLICTTLGWRAIGWVFSASTDPVLAQWHEDIRYWLWDKTPEFSIATSVHSADELFGAATRGLIEAAVTVEGAGAVTLDGQGLTRLFKVAAGGALTLNNLVVQNGFADGDGSDARFCRAARYRPAD